MKWFRRKPKRDPLLESYFGAEVVVVEETEVPVVEGAPKGPEAKPGRFRMFREKFRRDKTVRELAIVYNADAGRVYRLRAPVEMLREHVGNGRLTPDIKRVVPWWTIFMICACYAAALGGLYLWSLLLLTSAILAAPAVFIGWIFGVFLERRAAPVPIWPLRVINGQVTGVEFDDDAIPRLRATFAFEYMEMKDYKLILGSPSRLLDALMLGALVILIICLVVALYIFGNSF